MESARIGERCSGAQLELIDAQANTKPADRVTLEAKIAKVTRDWRSVLRKHAPQARQIIAKLLHGRLSIVPERRNGDRGFRVSGAGSSLRFFREISEIPLQAVASPMPASWNQIVPWLRQMDELRAA
jgi:hypothetical protein